MMIPLSVVVPNRNNVSWLAHCVDSILDQSLKKTEVIVVDDASTDESPVIIREYMNRFPGRVRGIFLARQLGVARARDHGFREARGQFVSSLDADDYLIHPQKLERELQLARTPSETGRSIAGFSGIIQVDAAGNRLESVKNPSIVEGRITGELLGRTCHIPRDFTFRRELYFQAGGFDSRYPIYEDWDFKLRLSALVDFYYTGLEGVAYRRHGTGLSAAPIPLHLRWQRRVFCRNRRMVAPPARRKALSALTHQWDDMRRRYLHQYLGGHGSPLWAWRYWIDLKTRGLPAPAWKRMLLRALHISTDPKEKQ